MLIFLNDSLLINHFLLSVFPFIFFLGGCFSATILCHSWQYEEEFEGRGKGSNFHILYIMRMKHQHG